MHWDLEAIVKFYQCKHYIVSELKIYDKHGSQPYIYIYYTILYYITVYIVSSIE